MINYKPHLEIIATTILNEKGIKPNFSNRDFMNICLIFMNALTDKMFDNQEFDNMDENDRLKMSDSCGKSLHKLVHTYTGLDMKKVEDFI